MCATNIQGVRWQKIFCSHFLYTPVIKTHTHTHTHTPPPTPHTQTHSSPPILVNAGKRGPRLFTHLCIAKSYLTKDAHTRNQSTHRGSHSHTHWKLTL